MIKPRRLAVAGALAGALLASAGSSSAAPRARARSAPAASTFKFETTGYLDYAAFSSALDRVMGGSRIARKVSIGRTLGGRDIWAVALGADAAKLAAPTLHVGEIHDSGANHPALLVVGGVDATQLAGSEEALRFVGRMASDYGKVDSVTALLDRATIYVVPRVSPDACELYFARPVVERTTNGTPTDDDRDGRLDEDAPRDLNGDGMITVMRVEDPRGEWLPNPADPRLLKRADRAKGELGRYSLYTEGRDLDGDDQYGEDGPGGVDFSRNWPNGFKYFTPGAGRDPMTELENRALADFMYDHANIAAVFVFEAQDNLVKPWKADATGGLYDRALAAIRAGDDDGPGSYGAGTGGQPAGPRTGGRRRGGPRTPDAPSPDPRITAPPSADADLYDFVSRQYGRLTGLKDAPESPPAEGDLGSFSYFDFGRMAFTARAWWPVSLDTAKAEDGKKPEGDKAEGAKPDMPGGAAGMPPGGGRGGMRRGGPGGGPGGAGAGKGGDDDSDLKDLKALTSRGIDAVLPWTPIEHPDFPGKKVEVGGFRPFVRTVPPSGALDTLAEKTSMFLADLASRLPRIELREPRAEKLGPGLARVTVEVVNAGYLPTVCQLGEIARWPRDVRVRASGARLVSGHELQLLEPIAGSGGFREVSWVVEGGSGASLTIIADSPSAGTAQVEVRLP